VIVAVMFSNSQASKKLHRIKRAILARLNVSPGAEQPKPPALQRPDAESEPKVLTAAESAAELQRLQKLIDDRKQIAWDTDISHHLWGLYKNLLPNIGSHSPDHTVQDGEWYDVKVLQVSTQNGLNKVEFELKGSKYKFVDDEEQQGWRENMKVFGLFLYDDSDRCLIEIPMKMNVDSSGRRYSISSGGPNAFLLSSWINDFIHVKLKHQSLHNQQIRAQKHQERLFEIEDLKNRFGILD
jgi:hypothetical protein